MDISEFLSEAMYQSQYENDNDFGEAVERLIEIVINITTSTIDWTKNKQSFKDVENVLAFLRENANPSETSRLFLSKWQNVRRYKGMLWLTCPADNIVEQHLQKQFLDLLEVTSKLGGGVFDINYLAKRDQFFYMLFASFAGDLKPWQEPYAGIETLVHQDDSFQPSVYDHETASEWAEEFFSWIPSSISTVTQPTTDTEETTMAAPKKSLTEAGKEVITDQAQEHAQAMILASKLEIGRMAIELIKEQLKPYVPPMAKVLLSTPFADLAIATSASAIVTVVSDDPRAKVVSNAMLTVAYGEILQTMQIPEMINGVLSKIPKRLFDKLPKVVEEPSED
jgi:hypothetical protein